MALTAVKTVLSYGFTFIGNNNGRGLNVEALDIITSSTRVFTDDATACSKLDGFVVAYRTMKSFEKGCKGADDLVAPDQPRDWCKVAEQVANCLSAVKALGAFGVGAIEPFNNILSVSSNLTGIIVEGVKCYRKVNFKANMGVAIVTTGQTLCMVYFKVLKMAKPAIELIAANFKDYDVAGLEKISKKVFDKRIVLCVSFVTLGHAALTHNNNQLAKALNLNRFLPTPNGS